VRVFERFLMWLPVRRLDARPDGQPLDAAATGHMRRVEWVLVAIAEGLAVLGFLGYYLPIYWAPQRFPSVVVTLPWLGARCASRGANSAGPSFSPRSSSGSSRF
jgi:hypothetical protein